MKTIIKTIGIITTILLIAYMYSLYSQVEKLREAADRAAYSEIERLEVLEAEGIEKYNDLFRKFFWSQAESGRKESEYIAKLKALKAEYTNYKDREFEVLEECQTGYNNLFAAYELSINLHDKEVKAIVKLKDEQIDNVRKSVSIWVDNYNSCNERVDLLKEIIARHKNKKWGWYIGAGPYIGFSQDGTSWGACLNFSFGRKIK
jgi:cbb3-type cytochrome oxidase subunit 3